jgi:DNA-binding SARP family transcriptional activator
MQSSEMEVLVLPRYKAPDLRVKTLGTLDVLVDGKSLFLPKQNHGKVNSLLQYLIVYQGKSCRPETIAEALWPDNEYVDERKVIHTYAHRLNQIFRGDNALGLDVTPHIFLSNVNGSYILRLSGSVTLDIQALRETVTDSAKLRERDEMISALNSIFELYGSHFLNDSVHYGLVLHMRNELSRICGDAVSVLCGRLFGMECFDDVLRTAERYFEIDECDEGVNYWYLKALQELGRNSHAARRFEYLTGKMRETLDIAPSDRLTGLFSGISGAAALSTRAAGGPPLPISREVLKQYLDDAHIRAIINDIVSEQMTRDAVKTQYTFMRVETDDDVGEISDTMFASAIVKSLRRNDMYAIIDSRTALVLLHDAQEEHFDIIRQRVTHSVLEMFGSRATDVKMWKANKVV